MNPFYWAGEDAGEVMAHRYASRVDGKSVEIERSAGAICGQQCRGVSSPLHGVEGVDLARSLGRPFRTVIKDGESASVGRRTATAGSHSNGMRRAGRNFNVQREESPGKLIPANGIAHVAGHCGQC